MLKYRRALGLSLIVITISGLILKFYRGAGQAWLNDTLGGIPYEIFWILLVAYLWPRLRPGKIAGGVFIVTCLLEVLQLWQPPWLQAVRATLLGRLVLGNAFDWGDFPYYAIGCLLGWGWLHKLPGRRE